MSYSLTSKASVVSAFRSRLLPAPDGAARPARTLDELRRRSEQVLAQVVVPDPFDLDVFCRQLSEQRDRPLHVVPLPEAAGVTGPCGAWAATDTADYLFYDPAAAPVHRELIVLHEVGHLLAGMSPRTFSSKPRTCRPQTRSWRTGGSGCRTCRRRRSGTYWVAPATPPAWSRRQR